MKNKKESSQKEKSQNVGYELLKKYASKKSGNYIASVLFAVLGVICSIAPYYGVYKMVIMLLNGNHMNFSDYFPWIGFCAVSMILWGIFHNISTAISHKATFETISSIRYDTCQKLVEIPMGFVLSKPSGVLKNSVVEKTDGIEPTLAHAIPELTSNLLVPLTIIVYIFTLDWKMGIASLITLPIGMLAMSGMMKDYEKNFKEYSSVSKKMNEAAVEYINGIEVIKAFGQSASSYEKYKKAVKQNAEFGINWMSNVQKYYALAFGILPSTLIGILPFGIWLLSRGSLSQENFILIILLSTGIFTPLYLAISFVDGLAQVNVALSDLAEISNYPPMVRSQERKNLSTYDIQFNNVSFSYDKRESENETHSESIAEPVLKGIDLKIFGNQVTALVGPSGSGKSTIAKLIAGFWDWQNGEITIGGIDAKEVPLTQLNDTIAYVTQDSFLFDESVMENIRKAKPNASDKEVIEAAKATGCHDFIMKLEKGYDTIVGSGGGHLSGGEKQRVSIARAMLKNAKVIIFDEATAYTDPENEAIIQEAVSKLIKGKTLIVIAHRLSTIKDSDQIVVVENGRINSVGKHDELLEKSSLYNSMWQAHMSSKDQKEA